MIGMSEKTLPFLVAACVLIAPAAVPSNRCEARQPTHPTIIFVIVDQLRYQACGYAGEPQARTPNLDNLADPWQIEDLAGRPECASLLADFRRKLTGKMALLHDTFPPSTWHERNWIENRIIKRTATIP
jgi:hypothetical protein